MKIEYMLSCSGVLDTDGKLTAPSKLTVLELTAELQARGLMTEGSRRELYKRVQVMRLPQHRLGRYHCCTTGWRMVHLRKACSNGRTAGSHERFKRMLCPVRAESCHQMVLICFQAARRSSAGSTSVAQTKRDLAASHKKYMKERGQKEVAREASKREVARLEVRPGPPPSCCC